MGKKARCNVIYNIYNFCLKCVAFYNDNLGMQENKLTAQPMILTTLTRDIQCEKFIEDESVSHEPCDSMYHNRVKEREDEVNN